MFVSRKLLFELWSTPEQYDLKWMGLLKSLWLNVAIIFLNISNPINWTIRLFNWLNFFWNPNNPKVSVCFLCYECKYFKEKQNKTKRKDVWITILVGLLWHYWTIYRTQHSILAALIFLVHWALYWIQKINKEILMSI